MGKKSTTVVNETGLGDGQFDTLSGNQTNIANSLDANANAASEAYEANRLGQEGIQTGVSDLSTANTTAFTSLGDANAAAAAEALEREKRIVASIAAQPTVDLSGLTAGQTKIGTDMATGFGAQDDRFDTVDTNLATANKGIVDANLGIDGLSDGQVTIAEGVAGGFKTSAANQADLTAGQKDYFEKAQLEREDLQKAVLSGQVTIKDLVDKYGKDGQIYYEDLAAKQKALILGQTGIQDGLDDFQSEYQQDFQNQGKFLGELKQSVDGGFSTTNTNLGATTGNLAKKVDNLGTGLGNQLKTGFGSVSAGQLSGTDLQAGFEANAADDFDYGTIASDIATATAGFDMSNEIEDLGGNFNELGEDVSGKFDQFGKALVGGFDEFGNKMDTNNETVGGYIDEMGKFVRADISDLKVTTADGQEVLAGQIADGTQLVDGSVKEGNRILSADQVKMRDAFTGKLDEVNNILTSQDSQLSSELRQQYMNLSQSFDEKGALIEESVDENGLRTNRAIDKQGNLIMAQFDLSGKRISQSNLNINDLIKGLDNQKYTGGTNYQMGTPSPAYNTRLGLMGPYTSTAGTPQYGQQ
jgi:hypothetical protein